MTFRKTTGPFNETEMRHQEKVANLVETQANNLKQTLKLIDIILSETKKSNTVEMFCVWAGDYKAASECNNTIDTTKFSLRENFEVAENEFVTFV